MYFIYKKVLIKIFIEFLENYDSLKANFYKKDFLSMKKIIAIIIVLVVSLPFVVAHFLKLPQEEKGKDTKVVQNKEEDLKNSLNTPNYKPKNNDFTVIDKAPSIPPDPFEDFEQETVYSEELAERVRNRRPSPFDKKPEPIPVLDYKPAKNGEYLYEKLNYGEEIDVQLPPKVGEKAPIKLKFEPNPANMDSIESFKITSLDGHVLEFDTFDRKTIDSEKEGLYVFKDLKNKSNNEIYIVYRAVENDSPSVSISVDHIKTGSFHAIVNARTKKGYIYKYKPVPSGTKYGRDFVIPEDFNNKKFK